MVGDALRVDALTIPRPGMINDMEWAEVDWDAKRWTIPAAKMKTGWDHVVPLSRQEGSASIHSITAFARHSSESMESFEYFGTAEGVEDHCELVRSEKNIGIIFR
ncbi:hypothetical protein [Bradyrhizobium sp. 186]|uniref:hypothetical protein n=1 Tax=Bradyrhizobium sp. 186 TaxID=2782654 RepID=UPI002000D48B|nr:hypothetical protein [Bradyrhizobium sp. 186]